MLLKCHVNVSFWQGVEKWNAKLSETELNLSSNRIIVGNVENIRAINQIILFGRVCVHFFPF